MGENSRDFRRRVAARPRSIEQRAAEIGRSAVDDPVGDARGRGCAEKMFSAMGRPRHGGAAVGLSVPGTDSPPSFFSFPSSFEEPRTRNDQGDGLSGPSGNVWAVGAQNAGKSTLINAIGKCVGMKVTHLTEAPAPGTTLGIVRMEKDFCGCLRWTWSGSDVYIYVSFF
ncbi:GTP-binding protein BRASSINAZOLE INSENSITIVE PALE GREEN 2, chloroplastic [Sesamum alatum]|uniref:GTP-binding protein BRASSINAZOLE INSENSITIVE PALE GREEN 2, chloroplastic n=1 Tax=Sesamum alatum TaxID=300844 RepID=A0AAE1YSL8_9LAMI|nr:GTP-binding protein BRASSINAZOLE INSENSITIVE PALE GREEN 2, chloroplastic [Sesamum alatum]